MNNFIIKLITASLLITTHFAHSAVFETRELQLAAKEYQLDYEIDIEHKKLDASGKITVTNISDSEATHIPLRLYRMLSVSKISDLAGEPIKFTQQIMSNEDWPLLQTNYIEVALKSPIKPSESYSFNIKFSGSLRGYSETGMSYVKDSIEENFSIIRMDAYAYPLVTYPNDNVNRKAKFWLHRYDYDVSVNVPAGYVVANGGELVDKKTYDENVTYRYSNKLPAWRMDFSVARYQTYSKGKYKVFSWESEQDSTNLLNQVTNTIDLYTKWFGPLAHELGYTFIEVPENYGAQADVTSVIQDASGFKELDRVYHEISHQWNVKSLDQFSPRWNEGLATFLEALTLDLVSRPDHLVNRTQETILNLRKTFSKNDKYRATPFIDYGKEKLNSYSVGMIFYRLLYDLMGQSDFNKVIGGFYQNYHEKGATTEEFIRFVKDNSNAKLDALFDEWAYGTDYVSLINKKQGYTQILAHYK